MDYCCIYGEWIWGGGVADSTGYSQWGYIDQSWMYLSWTLAPVWGMLYPGNVSLLVLAPTLMNITVRRLRIGVRNVRGFITGWRLRPGVYSIRGMKAPVWGVLRPWNGSSGLGCLVSVDYDQWMEYMCDIYKLVSVDYDFWMEYLVSFTVDVYVITMSLYSWIIIGLYSDSVLHCEYECDIYILVMQSLGLGRGF